VLDGHDGVIRRRYVSGMTQIDRRRLLALGAASLALPAAIQKAWAIDAKSTTGTIADVKHVVILMQENRSFDHYFGTMKGVRGFGDRFPIPLPGGKTVWSQAHTKAEPPVIAPFHLNTVQTFQHMRVEGTPHNWADAQYAWDQGRMGNWPDHKKPHAMGYFTQADIPFQWALADAFTICDAYHCSFQGGTNTNRLFLWSGTNDGEGTRGGPSISNSHDTLPEKQPPAKIPYTWTTYPERLEAAGVSWKIYEDMADNFGDNPLVGFKAFRDSLVGAGNPALAAKGLATQHLDVLRADAMAGTLPSVSWVISPAKDSEHPGPSSPAQGADYIARVLDALTANPEVWAQTVLLINYDENDGFFDHAPPPAPPSVGPDGKRLGGSTVDLAGEYHRVRIDSEKTAERDDLMGRPYGLGPRVPMYVVSPFSRGGWVNSEVFDHTSVIRFLERRFGVMEPNISAWRRAVCGDLSSCFDFKTPNAAVAVLPGTADVAGKAAALPGRTTPPTPAAVQAPTQGSGMRPSRALPYRFDIREELGGDGPALRFNNLGPAGVVFHVYNLLERGAPPRRYTVSHSTGLVGEWPVGAYDLAVFGPNGFYRRYAGAGGPKVTAVEAKFLRDKPEVELNVLSVADGDVLSVVSEGYAGALAGWTYGPGVRSENAAKNAHTWSLEATHGWYDFTVRSAADPTWLRRFAGRHETGVHGISDPAMGGAAVMSWS
jgi:phospholipase C